jgi:ADP-heptose:LPS heptosyltransferase
VAVAGPSGGTVLVLRALGLGDLLTAVPAIRGLRAALPGHRLVLATPRALTGLVALVAAVDEVLPVKGLHDRQAWAGRPPPELAVNLHGRGPQSHRLLMALGPGRLLAHRSVQLGVPGPPWREETHEVSRWCHLVEAGLGQPVDRTALDLAMPGLAPPTPGAVVVHPGAGYASRRWPEDRFAAVCRSLAEAGHDVVVTGSAAEAGLARRVVQLAGLDQAADLAGRLDLVELAAVVGSCRLLIAGDTGVAHLASAYRRPSVLLFGPVAPSRWGPPGRPQHVVLWHGDGTGDPWGTSTDPALARIAVEEVLAAADGLLTAGS